MVETWRNSWFEEGSRLLYIVPPAFVNKVLPLSIKPAPAQTVRVFVGKAGTGHARHRKGSREGVGRARHGDLEGLRTLPGTDSRHDDPAGEESDEGRTTPKLPQYRLQPPCQSEPAPKLAKNRFAGRLVHFITHSVDPSETRLLKQIPSLRNGHMAAPVAALQPNCRLRGCGDCAKIGVPAAAGIVG